MGKKSYVLGFDNFFKQDFSFTWMADSRAARYGHVPFGCTTPGNNILYYTTQPTPACQLRIIVLVCLSLEVEILLCTFHLASSLYLKLISIFNFKSFVSLLFLREIVLLFIYLHKNSLTFLFRFLKFVSHQVLLIWSVHTCPLGDYSIPFFHSFS